jgi:hypothetical protein
LRPQSSCSHGWHASLRAARWCQPSARR